MTNRFPDSRAIPSGIIRLFRKGAVMLQTADMPDTNRDLPCSAETVGQLVEKTENPAESGDAVPVSRLSRRVDLAGM